MVEASHVARAVGRIVIAVALVASLLVGVAPRAAAATGFSISDAQVWEGDSGTTTMTFTVTLAEPPVLGATVDYSTSDFTAAAPDDYTATSGTLSFSPLAPERTVSVTIQGDTTLEGNEVFFVGLSNSSGPPIDDGSATGTILNDDGPAITVHDASVTEGDSDDSVELVFPVTFDAASSQAVSVDYTTTPDTASEGATSPADYQDATGTLTVPAGETTATIAVTINPDDIDETDETFTLTLSDPTGDATLADATATGTIHDDDGAVVLKIADVVQAEGDPAGLDATTTFGFKVTVEGATEQAVAFDFTTVTGTATGGAFSGQGDYVATSGRRTIPAGSTETSINVTVNRDTTPEPDEQFTVVLSNPSNAEIADPVGVGNILNDDAAITVADAIGEECDCPLGFEVAIPFPSQHEVTVDYATTDGTATASSDYTTTSGTATIPAGETATTVEVPLLDDTTDENDETFTLSLSGAVNATVADDSATGTIGDDDDPPVLDVVDVAYPEEQAGQTTRQVTVTLSQASAKSVTVQYTTRDGTATAGSDYTATSGTLTFAPGQTIRTIDVAISGDAVAEPDETLFVDLADPVNATIGMGTGTVTIENDDETLVVESTEVVETDGATTVDVTVRLGAAPDPGEEVTVDYATADGTATAGADYTAATGTLTFTEGETVETITIAILGDTTGEADETFTVSLSNETGAVVPPAGRTATITIADDDDVRLRVSDAAVTEGDAGPTTLTFTVTLSQATAGDVTFDYAAADGTAEASSLLTTGDYEEATGTGTITAGNTATTIDVTVNGDTDPEDFETLTLTISNEAGTGLAGIADAEGIGTIRNDDTVVALAGDAEASEGNAVPFVVTLSYAVADDLTIDVATTAGTATAGDDYTAPPATAVVPAGDTHVTIPVATVEDGTDEPDEDLTLTISNPTGGDGVTMGTADATGTIRDDDAPPTVSIDDVTVTEGDSGTTDAIFTVELSAPSAFPITVGLATADGTATVGDDYDAVSTTVEFAPGETSHPVTVTVLGDTLDEFDETFQVVLSDPENAAIADGSGTGTIEDDDDGVVGIADATAAEGDLGTTTMTFVVTLSAPAPGDVTVDYATVDGTAAAGSDYTATSGTATIPAGDTATTITVDVLGDTAPETNEQFTVALSNPTSASLGRATATGTIADDDVAPSAPVADAGPDQTVAEGTDVSFDGSGSGDADGDIVDYAWDFGDGETATGPTPSHAFADDGAYTVTLTVTDEGGMTDTDTVVVTVTNVAPTIVVAADPAEGESPLTVAFTATTSDPGADDLAVAWKLGDGATATGTETAHTYAAAGSYLVTATVTDDDGDSTSDSITVVVGDAGAVTRAAGADRILTAVEVSRSHWPEGKSPSRDATTPAASDAVLARSDLFADALAAGPLAAALDAPLLLTTSDQLPDVVREELARLGVARVTLLGGTGAIAAGVADELRAAGYEVDRIAGADRFDTAAQVADRLGLPAGGDVALALGIHENDARAWPDALSAGALAASPDRVPILLTAATNVPEATRRQLDELRPGRVLLVGGTAAISPTVEDVVRMKGYATTRLSGADRYATSVAVARDALSRAPSGAVPVVFATGANYPDGLAAAALAARLGGIVLLVPPTDLDTATPGTVAFLEEHVERFDVGVIVGGPGAVSFEVEAGLEEAMSTG